MVKYDILINTREQYYYKNIIGNISYRMTKTFICFSFTMKAKMNKYDFQHPSQNLVKLTKSFLSLYLLKFSKPLEVKYITIIENNKIVLCSEYSQENSFPLYGIVNKKLIKKTNLLSKNPLIIKSLFGCETKSLRTVINYYLIGMSKIFENDRFYYLFSSLNSLVNIFVPNIKNDFIKFSRFLKEIIKCQHDLVGKTSKRFLTSLEDFLYKKPYLIFEDFILNLNILEDEYVKCFDEEDTISEAREFFKYQFVYYLRCNIVHGEKTSVLYTLKKDANFILLQYANYVIAKLIEDTLMREDIQKYLSSAAIFEQN